MEPRFTRGEYFLLEIVVEYEWSISGLIDNELELHLNKKGHGLTRASLLESLYRLLSSGLIYAKNEVDGFISTYEQIESALNEPPRGIAPAGVRKHTVYGLTQEGGEQWEAFAAPDWEKYIEEMGEGEDESGDERYELICADKAWLEKYFESFCFYHQIEVSLESMEWDYISPWEVTYWKQLEGAHILRFQERDQSEVADYDPPPNPEWYHSVWCVWR